MIKRELYLKKIRPFINKPFIKVITGIRRSGKSAIMMILKEELIENGINKENLIYINFESMQFSDIENEKDLYNYIKEKIINDKTYYIFLDEIQEVKNWEKAVNSIMLDFKSDVYITGSNSRLLSSELATYIAGRYIEFTINTLSFKEYLEFKKAYSKKYNDNIKDAFTKYLRFGGFPVIHTAEYDYEMAYKVINDIYSSAILRDTIQRYNIRNIELLERVVKYVFDNLGNIFSAKKVADYFKSQQRKVDLNTIYNYLNALESSFIIQKVQRYDVKGKEILQTNEKYYLGDQSLKYAVMGYKDREISGILENIVYLELKRRNYKVYIGKIADKEIDFVAENKNEKIYVQVSYKMNNESTITREFSPLLEINDNYPKYVVTMDDFWQDNIEGIKHKHISEFLLMDNF